MFDRIASVYDWLTANPLWRESIQEMARHLPPSGSRLRLIDVGGRPAHSAHALLLLRPDLHIVALDLSIGMFKRGRPKADQHIALMQADAHCLPFADSSVDAITAHSVFYLLRDTSVFLAEARRVLRPGGRLILLDPAQGQSPISALSYFPKRPRAAISVLLWHLVGQANQRVTPESMARALDSAGFARVLGERSVEDFGVLSRGEKPYPIVNRPINTLIASEEAALQPIRGDQIGALRSPFIFLLIRQTPNQPIWSLPPDTPIRWEAATLRADFAADVPIALAFTALPKAVAFMQPAVTANALIGVTRIAKFPADMAAQWTFPLLINPAFAALQADQCYRFSDRWLPIDPQDAISGDE